MKLSRWWRCGALLAAVALLGTACQSSGGSGSSTSGAEKTLVYATPALPLTYDPCFITGQQTAEILTNLYSFWAYYKVGTLPDGAPGDSTQAGENSMGPGMLKSWDLSPDGTVYTLHIRQGAKDSYGNEMTATDMQWVLDRVSHLGGCPFVTSNMGITDVSKQVAVVDKYTVKVTLSAPDPIFIRMLAVNNGAAVGPEARKHVTSDDPWAANWAKANAAATGPYKVESLSPGVQMVLVSNPNFYGPKPEITKIIYKEVPQASNRVAVLLSGQAQAARDLSQDQLNQISQNKNANIQCTTANDMMNVAINAASGPTANPQVRQALAYAVPYDDIIKSVFNSRAKRLYGMVPSLYPAYIGDGQYPYSLDINKAKQMLASAGYPNGFNATVMIDTATPEHERAAILLQNSLKQIGVNLSIDTKPIASYTDALQGHTYGDLAIWQDHSLVIDIDYHAKLFLAPGPPPSFNFSGWLNPEFIALEQQAVAMPGGPQRDTVLQRMQAIFNQNVPWLSLANTPTCFAFLKKVSGYVWHTFNQVYFSDLKLGS